MKCFPALSWLIGIAAVLTASQALAQSGVISGPPQVVPDRGPGYPSDRGPGMAPGPGGPGGPGLRPGPAVGDGSWIAVAGGFDRDGRRVSVGYSGYQRSRLEAEDAAIRACSRQAPSVSCQSAFAVATGCLFIIPGDRPNGGVTWGRGGTREAAMMECRRGGYTCRSEKLIGGCLPGYN